MEYKVEVEFGSIYELLNSLHTYLCKKSYKKIDLGVAWANEIESTLSEELLSRLKETELNNEWKMLNLLIYCCPFKDDVDSVLNWIEGLSVGELYETLSKYVKVFPSHMEDYRNRVVFLLSEWNRQYFSQCNPAILSKLQQHADSKNMELNGLDTADFVNKTTNGFYFMPTDGLKKLVLIPQYHFQPANIIYCYGELTICHYAAWISMENEELSPFMYRAIRSLSEKSRLKILQALSGGRKTFTEIVKHAGISKGIVHDHIFNLRCAGLLHAYIEGENVTGYSLRLEGIHRMNEQLFEYLK
ncbi:MULTISPECIES: winged helix-turn-helix domain-containing protein [unclassified Paenibacillus]|uniref:ArsR/SmtB family transcription factor n=1 Tax=unclassified Paenibacillus TaxID=185978 RepID=UPI0024758828|nr:MULTISPECIES: winged helix-turn-helix domain-containing protein [unclassified Paenibacillus]MDH6427795.1 DNA-binding transcriptional ArsR family regulator [Paenibacillus sp. PastH-4]MDH6444579.1 DNA-binding transcriptional ArsR family regulator [Paenibacillus sp. PastF-4]MDH6528476.1 DNA-binding transcriptional ArsR family regulator [Paenibacillus sp. PastH-3]